MCMEYKYGGSYLHRIAVPLLLILYYYVRLLVLRKICRTVVTQATQMFLINKVYYYKRLKLSSSPGNWYLKQSISMLFWASCSMKQRDSGAENNSGKAVGGKLSQSVIIPASLRRRCRRAVAI